MRASQAQTPQPLPLPPPPLSLPSTPSTTVPRRRSRTSSSSSSVSTASSFSPSTSPAPSPPTTSVVPFSWEHHPGIPKSSLAGLMSSGSAPLPLPPPLRPSPPRRLRQRRRRRANEAPSSADPNADPFAAAFVECTREDVKGDVEATGVITDKLIWSAPASSAVSGRAVRPWWLAGGGVAGLLDISGCKSALAVAVADGAFLDRRPMAARPGGPGRATRR